EKSLYKLQEQLAVYLGTDKIDIGFESYDEESSSIKALHGAVRGSKLLGAREESTVEECFCDFSFDALLQKRDFFAISNVKEMRNAPSQFIKRMYDMGVGSFIVAPLKYKDEIIAFIELTSPNQGVLNSMVANRLRTVLPMFTVAVSRSIDSYQTELEAIIQHKFTSIHPTVTWKFFDAAEHIFRNRGTERKEEMPNITFNDVYPIYGQFDIRGSSDARNTSIQADLMEQLSLAEEEIQKAVNHERLPIYQQLLF